MVTKLKQVSPESSLYETDYHLWLLETVEKLKHKNFETLDLENLIEEVLDLSKRDKRKLKSLLRRLFEHLLKLKYWNAERDYNEGHWRGEIMNFRKQIKDQLQDSPSLKPYLLEVFAECYQDSREITAQRTQLPLETFPVASIANLEEVLDENWLP